MIISRRSSKRSKPLLRNDSAEYKGATTVLKLGGSSAEGAEGGGACGGGVPSPLDEGPEEGAVPPPQKFF